MAISTLKIIGPSLIHRAIMGVMFIVLFVLGSAQTGEIQGIVQDENGLPLIGVSIELPDFGTGTISDSEGAFRVQVNNVNQALLKVSYVGYIPVETTANTRELKEIVLQEDTKQLSEVVVTALGLQRQKRSLGYATQDVSGSELTEARETNVVNSLAGKVAGVNVSGGVSTSMGSSNIVIRGESSLSGDNQPLFIVDGIPINNAIESSPNTRQDIDFGNGAMDINPDDIESINVLKGPNAAALYGSRAANGVILITTKTGKNSRGIGVSVNSNIAFENVLRLPDFQNEYGQGRGDNYNIGDGGRSWGPRLDGRLINIPVNTEFPPSVGEEVPWVPYPDNVREFYQTGTAYTNNIAIAGSNDKGNFRLSYTNLDQTGIVPNTGLKRNTLGLNAGFNFTDWVTVSTSINYMNTNSNNRPVISYGNESPAYTWIWEGRQVRTDDMEDYWFRGLEGLRPFTYNFRFNDNPYYGAFENLNGMKKDRLYGNIVVNMKLTSSLNLMLRSGMDYSSDFRSSRRTFGSNAFPNGMYKQDQLGFRENNSDFLLTYNASISRDWNLRVSGGGNIMTQSRDVFTARANGLSIPGVYNLGNARFAVETANFFEQRRINSFYGIASADYKNMLFFDVTARNDWSSTLPINNNSYFYPSFSTSAVISELFNLNAIIPKLTYAKVRASWAQVGNDTNPYSLRNFYQYQLPWGTTQTVSVPGNLANANLLPEVNTSFEIGFDMSMFDGRVGLDITYYDAISRNQIINVPISEVSGFTNRTLNAGEIRNSGLEIMLNLIPIKLSNGFTWNMNINWSRNIGRVIELGEGLETYQLGSRYVSVEAREGGRMGDMYGRIFERDPNGNIVHVAGLAQTTDELFLLGNYNPDWMAGIYNTFKYKGFSFGFLFDIRYGGVIYSRTHVIGNEAGQLVESLPGREGGWVGEGTMLNGDGQYVPNDVNVTAERYWGGASFFRRNNAENATFDATFVKLRELRIGYTLPDIVIKNARISRPTISIVGRNLLLFTGVPHIDPEIGSLSGGTMLRGVESVNLPTTRSFGINFNCNF